VAYMDDVSAIVSLSLCLRGYGGYLRDSSARIAATPVRQPLLLVLTAR